MTITCPHCRFSREVPADRVPPRTVRIVCPQCGERFPWQRPVAPVPRPKVPAAPAPPRPAIAQPPAPTARPATAAVAAAPASRACAGFALRCVAQAIDAVVYSVVLMLLVFGMSLIIADVGSGRPEVLGPLSMLAGLVVLFFGPIYQVCFIGYCGQTPGKMATRIKVVRSTGAEVGFGAALFREVIGKLVSALLLGCGFLMILFDERRQGLHDKIADTIVVKL